MIKHKNSKISLTAYQSLILLVGAYSPKKVQLKPFIKTMEDAAASTTPAIKAEGLNFFKECYRWMGDGPVIEALIKNLKQQQIVSVRFYHLCNIGLPQGRIHKAEGRGQESS